jgi:hypothetical protein
LPGGAGHEAGQIRLALDHFRRRMPIRPLRLAADLQKALPGKSLAADADAVADRVRWVLNEVEVPLHSIDDDDAGRLLRSVEHRTLLEIFRKISGIAVIYSGIDVGRGGLELKERPKIAAPAPVRTSRIG